MDKETKRNMPTDIHVEMYDFSQLSPDTGHIVIHVDIGKMSPPRAAKYLTNVSEDLSLCRQLRGLGINYSLAGCRDGKMLAVVVHESVSAATLADFNFTTVEMVSDPMTGCEIKKGDAYDDAMAAIK